MNDAPAFDNPMGTDGFEFIEYTAPNPELLGSFFEQMGFSAIARHRSKDVVLYRQGLINFVSLPMYMCSGVFFSADRFPGWSQPIVRALPLTALNDALRRVITDGVGVTAIATQIGIVAAWGAVAFAIALKLFRWR